MGNRLVRVVADSPEKFAVGYSGGGDEDVLATHQVLGGEHLAEVVTEVLRAPPLLLVARVEAPEQGPTEAPEGAGGEYPLGCSTDADHHVDARVGLRRHDRPSDISIQEKLDPGTSLPDLPDKVSLVPWAIQDAHGEILNRELAGRRDAPQVGLDRRLEFDDVD